MRSRYTAYAMGNAQYLYRTWHEKTRPTLASLRKAGAQKLVALKIVSKQAGGENDSKGMVEFIASSETTNPEEPIYQHHEKSLFIKIKDQWLYIDRI
jgi:SEC-C motif-containing protein